MSPEKPNFDGRPDSASEMRERELEVIRKVDELEIGLDLRKHPELARRLVEIGAHFEDSLEIAKVIRKVYGQVREAIGLEEETPEHLMRGAVLHDIGKSGPAGKEGEFNHAVQRLFVPSARPFLPYEHGRAHAIAEYVASQELPDGAEIIAALRSAGYDPDAMPMINFWRQHAQWTYDILETQADVDVDARVIEAAASHHLCEHRDPAALHPETARELPESLKMAGVIEIVDKYQANRDRWGRNHEDAVAWVEKALANQPDLPPAVIQNFRAVLDVLRAHPDLLG